MNGALPSQTLRRLIETRAICADTPVTPAQIQPASLDLRLGAQAWRVRASFLAGKNRTVKERLADFQMHAFSLDGGAVLERGCVYLIPLMEALDLPDDIAGAASAKSSIGRLDLFTRIITDQGVEFDRVARGYKGPLYAEVSPRSFSVVVHPGLCLTQIVFRKGDGRLDDPALHKLHAAQQLVNGTANINDGLGFSVDLKPQGSGIVGYRAKPHTDLIDLSKINHYDPQSYWEPVTASDESLILDPGAFYILASREAVHVPPDYAAEMAPYVAMVGEFRVHYAGFFDPGFGHAPAGGHGSRGVLEVRCHEAPFVLEHGQTVGRLIYETMTETPDVLYGIDLKSNYQGQGLKLSKHFKSR
jgi:dCTP deaminase